VAEPLCDERDPGEVRGVHVCGLVSPVPRAVLADLEDFARTLAAPAGGGLGWS
jgi:hypothetical protein